MVDISVYQEEHPSENSGPLIEDEDAELDNETMTREKAPEDDTITLLPVTLPGYNLRLKEWGRLLTTCSGADKG